MKIWVAAQQAGRKMTMAANLVGRNLSHSHGIVCLSSQPHPLVPRTKYTGVHIKIVNTPCHRYRYYGVFSILQPHLYLWDILLWDILLWYIRVLLQLYTSTNSLHKPLTKFFWNTLSKKYVNKYFYYLLLQKFLSKESNVVNINSKPQKGSFFTKYSLYQSIMVQKLFNSHLNSFFYLYLYFYVFLTTVQLILINLRAL